MSEKEITKKRNKRKTDRWKERKKGRNNERKKVKHSYNFIYPDGHVKLNIRNKLQ